MDAAANVTVRAIPAIAGITVYAMRPDGSVATRTTTDSHGLATAPFAGGSVSTVEPYLEAPDFAAGQRFAVHTWLGVKAGDTLLVEPVERPASPPPNQVLTLALPTAPGDTNYIIEASCGGYAPDDPAVGAQTITTTFYTTCTTETRMDITVEAFQGHVPVVVDAFTKLDVPISDGAQIDLTGEAYHAAVQRQVTVDHAGTSNQGLEAIETFTGPNELAPSQQLFHADGATSAGNTSTGSFPVAVLPAGVRDDIQLLQSAPLSQLSVTAWGISRPTFTIDWAASATPTFTTKPMLDAATQTWSWTMSQAPTAPQSYAIRAAATRTDYAFTWEVDGPADGTSSLAFPTLPTDIATFTLTDADTLARAEVATTTLGWDALRQAIGYSLGAPPLAVSATGTLASTYFTDPPLARTPPGKRL